MKRLILAALLCYAPLSNAVTLSEYGITLNSTGLTDSRSGLRWLDSTLTQGHSIDLQPLFDAGWRLATEEEFALLLFGGPPLADGEMRDIPLDYADYLTLTERLGVSPDSSSGEQPWLCRQYDSTTPCNQWDMQNAVSFFLLGEDLWPDTPPVPGLTDITPASLITYISEVQLYGSIDCSDIPCDTFVGRSLLVRPVPVPAAFPLLFTALVGLYGLYGLRGRTIG